MKKRRRDRAARRSAERQAGKRLQKLEARIEAGEASEAEKIEAGKLGEVQLYEQAVKVAEHIENAIPNIEVLRSGSKAAIVRIALAECPSERLDQVKERIETAVERFEDAVMGGEDW